MKNKTVELVLERVKSTVFSETVESWHLRTMEGEYLDSFCVYQIQQLFNPGRETCLILEVKAYPAEWVGDA